MRQGANLEDQKKIAQLARKGKSAKWISKYLAIDIKCVKSFMPEVKEPTGDK